MDKLASSLSVYTAQAVVGVLVMGFVALSACWAKDGNGPLAPGSHPDAQTATRPLPKNRARVVHVFVALCDNEHQGIVPVPAAIGNGEDADRNLYWGAAFGVRTFFAKNPAWKLLAKIPNPNDGVLERCVFEDSKRAIYLVADAYRGAEIQRATREFLESAAGRRQDDVLVHQQTGDQTIYVGGSANLVVYVGHDGLMDFTLPEYPEKADDEHREAIILACASKAYFADPLRRAGATPLLWTTNLMAPEAYVLAAALAGWAAEESNERIRDRAATAYSAYQKCGKKSALALFATGW